MRRFVLVVLLAGAAAEERARGVDEILSDHVRALGAVADVRTLRATAESGPLKGVRISYRLPDLCVREFPSRGLPWREFCGPDGAFVQRGLFERFRPNQRTTRGSYYVMKALAEPFPLLAYARDPARRALLSVGHAELRGERFDVLFTRRDDHGVRAVFLLDPTTHLLRNLRFEEEENRPFANVTFADHREVEGVMLPHGIFALFVNLAEDEEERAFEPRELTRDERIVAWQVNPPLLDVDFTPPGLAPRGGKAFERLVFPTGPDPHELAVGDLDGDGRPDLAVACEGGVHVHFGGSEGEPVRIPLGGGHHRGLVIDDFRCDGGVELLTTSNLEPDRTFWFVGFDGERTPTVRDLYGAPLFTHAIVADDLDLDGIPDVIASGYGSHDLEIRFGNGAGGFRTAFTPWPLRLRGGTERGLGVAVGDIDANRMRDIAVADGNRVIIFRGEFNLFFQPRIAIPEKHDPERPWLPVAVALADLDGDGRDDLLVAREHPLQDLEEDVVVLMNTGEAFKATAAVDMGVRVQAVAAAQLDADPAPDVAAVSFLTGELVFRPGDGSGGLGPPQRFASGRGACRLAVVDWDGDGRQDLAVANRLDDSVAIFLNRLDAPRVGVPSPARAVPAKGPTEAEFRLEGLSEPYEFAGEFELPAEIRDPSGIACLGSVPAHDQLVIVSDKRSALFRLTLDRVNKRLLVGPAIPLIGLERERLDLEGVAWDHWTGNLFLGCEADSSIIRANPFGHVLARAKSGIESTGNDGIEAVAFRRLKDGTPLLYVFRERLGTTLAQPPFDVYGMEDEPFELRPRHTGLKLPVRVADQSGATVIGGRMFVVSRLSRELIELPLEDDLFAEGVRRASYLQLVDGLLGLRSRLPPHFGNVEGVTLDWDLDLFLLVDNNGETLGVAGRNEGDTGRLLWFRCLGKGEARPRPARVRARRLVVPHPGPEEAGAAAAKARVLLERIRAGEAPERLADEFGLAPPSELRAVDNRARPLPGEKAFMDLPLALGRLLLNLEVGEAGLCEWHQVEAPEGWSIVWREE